MRIDMSGKGFTRMVQVATLPLLGTLTGCGLFSPLPAITPAQKAATAVLAALADVEKNNPYSTGLDATCTYLDGKVTVQSGEQKKTLDAAALKKITCSSTQAEFSVTIMPTVGREFTQKTSKDPDLMGARKVALETLQAMDSTESSNANSNGADAVCDFTAPTLTVTSGKETRKVAAPEAIISISCSNTIGIYTVEIKTKKGLTLTQKQNKPEDRFAGLVARDVLKAMAEVEEANLSYYQRVFVCDFTAPQITVTAGTASLIVDAPLPVNGVTCTSTATTYSVTVTTSDGHAVTRTVAKDPAILERDRKAAETVANSVLDAMALVEKNNLTSTGADATCSAIASGSITVISGAEVQEVPAPLPVNSITCTSTQTIFSVTANTTRGVSFTLTRPKDPAIMENDRLVAETVAQNVAHALLEVEKANPDSTGADGLCAYNTPTVSVISGAEHRDVAAPLPVTSVTCSSSLSSIDVTVWTARGNQASFSLTK
ncbi:hypothetical protein [Deinococcus roseus]|uniref:Lipoprotein n=1 Tax=Deinococcus roseus TaxID=392414 RepID=A0ABQ2D2I7_9DEIO|nr:hypothetical protein [Deinococcus roseus]GGJ42497.1 hypothetical protein GCM10008938_30790 [Deinococcus roseus]